MAYEMGRRFRAQMTGRSIGEPNPFHLRRVCVTGFDTSPVTDPPAINPAEHSATLIALGYMVNLAGRPRMKTPGRRRIREGFEMAS
jgi:hypothetical protein